MYVVIHVTILPVVTLIIYLMALVPTTIWIGLLGIVYRLRLIVLTGTNTRKTTLTLVQTEDVSVVNVGALGIEIERRKFHNECNT